MRDFSESQVLERLLMYEKRIESSLYKAMNELQKLQCLRKREQVEVKQSAIPPLGEAAAWSEGEKMNCEKQSQSVEAAPIPTLHQACDPSTSLKACPEPVERTDFEAAGHSLEKRSQFEKQSQCAHPTSE